MHQATFTNYMHLDRSTHQAFRPPTTCTRLRRPCVEGTTQQEPVDVAVDKLTWKSSTTRKLEGYDPSSCPLALHLSAHHQLGTGTSDFLRAQARLSILCWNNGPRHSMPTNVDAAIAGRWHVVALQEVDTHLSSFARAVPHLGVLALAGLPSACQPWTRSAITRRGSAWRVREHRTAADRRVVVRCCNPQSVKRAQQGRR